MSRQNFSLNNFFGNLISLAYDSPDPHRLAQWCSEITGEEFRVVPANQGSAQGSDDGNVTNRETPNHQAHRQDIHQPINNNSSTATQENDHTSNLNGSNEDHMRSVNALLDAANLQLNQNATI